MFPPTPDLKRAKKEYEKLLKPLQARASEREQREKLRSNAEEALVSAKMDVLKNGGLLLPKVSAANSTNE